MFSEIRRQNTLFETFAEVIGGYELSFTALKKE
jgi:hypothetical protein